MINIENNNFDSIIKIRQVDFENLLSDLQFNSQNFVGFDSGQGKP